MTSDSSALSIDILGRVEALLRDAETKEASDYRLIALSRNSLPEVIALAKAAAGLIEQIELEIGPCDGTVNSRLWPTANDTRKALSSLLRVFSNDLEGQHG